jgi:hypothetical protein
MREERKRVCMLLLQKSDPEQKKEEREAHYLGEDII